MHATNAGFIKHFINQFKPKCMPKTNIYVTKYAFRRWKIGRVKKSHRSFFVAWFFQIKQDLVFAILLALDYW